MSVRAKIWVRRRGKWVKDVYKNQSDYVLRNDDEEDQVDNMIQLPHLNEPSILNGVSLRYQKNQIYTFTGEILLSLNPCQDLGLYTNKLATKYRNHEFNKPHLYYIAQRALDHLYHKNQSILVSGESGAGKTHAAREIMKFLGSEGNEKIIQSNPILEGLGNASTIYNPNSSRFGKFINMYFEDKTLVGAGVKTYLLEKRRVTHQEPDEKNFHIFYQVGLDGDFHYRNGNDVEDSKEIEEACALLNVDWLHIKNTVRGILWLGNDDIEKATPLLNLDHHKLKMVLRERTITTAGETIAIPLSEEERVVVRDSLAMALYQQLFDNVVQQINKTVSQQKTFHSISILDIFGFECFDKNSLEQFCINYSNERLQSQFNNFVFMLEQEEYKKEGIGWKDIDFPDNSECIDMIQGRLGIIDLLEEECKFPKGSDTSFTSKLNRKFEEHASYSVNKRFQDEKFVVNHYAGQVEYSTQGFVFKNRNMISQDAAALVDSGGNQSTQKVGICGQFRSHLKELVSVIESSQTSYVRCIKPNMGLVSNCIDTPKVITQLRYCGVVEVIRIARSGYSVRMIHSEFEKLYWMVDSSQVKGIVKGLTKVFMKHSSYEELEVKRREILEKYTICIQSWFRSNIARKRYLAHIIGMKRLIQIVKFRHQTRIGVLIRLQAWTRSTLTRQWYSHLRSITLSLQMRFRYKNMLTDIRFLTILQTRFRLHFKEMRIGTITIQTWFRYTVARKRYKRLRHYTIILQRNHRKKAKDIEEMKVKWDNEKKNMEQKTNEMRSQMIKCIDHHVVEKMKMADEMDQLRMENLRLKAAMQAPRLPPKKSIGDMLKEWWLS